MKPLPAEIVSELMRQQAAMGWPDMVPSFVELPDASGKDFYHRYQDLTVALCEQGVEHHSRLARLILSKGWWRRNIPCLPSPPDVARHILLARLLRCRYIQLTGKQTSSEDDMPFAHNQW